MDTLTINSDVGRSRETVGTSAYAFGFLVDTFGIGFVTCNASKDAPIIFNGTGDAIARVVVVACASERVLGICAGRIGITVVQGVIDTFVDTWNLVANATFFDVPSVAVANVGVSVSRGACGILRTVDVVAVVTVC